VTPSEYRDYDDYLDSDVWGALAERVLERDGHRCCLLDQNGKRCLKHQPRPHPRQRKLQVHHKTYSRPWGDERLEDLVTVCWLCHGAIHGHADPQWVADCRSFYRARGEVWPVFWVPE
jgi:hypothetical protein